MRDTCGRDGQAPRLLSFELLRELENGGDHRHGPGSIRWIMAIDAGAWSYDTERQRWEYDSELADEARNIGTVV